MNATRLFVSKDYSINISVPVFASHFHCHPPSCVSRAVFVSSPTMSVTRANEAIGQTAKVSEGGIELASQGHYNAAVPQDNAHNSNAEVALMREYAPTSGPDTAVAPSTLAMAGEDSNEDLAPSGWRYRGTALCMNMLVRAVFLGVASTHSTDGRRYSSGASTRFQLASPFRCELFHAEHCIRTLAS